MVVAAALFAGVPDWREQADGLPNSHGRRRPGWIPEMAPGGHVPGVTGPAWRHVRNLVAHAYPTAEPGSAHDCRCRHLAHLARRG